MTEQATAANPTANPTMAIDQALAELAGTLEGNLLVSQERCVDGLLDLYNAVSNDLVRQLVAGMIDEIRHLSAVRAGALRAQLNEVTAALAVELAFC
jgi:hypothetical protein